MVFRRVNKKVWMYLDWQIPLFAFLLCSLGLMILYSAGFDPEVGYSPPMKRQAMSMGVGLIAFLSCMFISTSFWKRVTPLIYLAGCGLLLFILFDGVVAGGARRWLDLGPVRMQPSEFMKLGVILALARIFTRERAPRDGYTIVSLLIPFLVLLVPVVLIIKEPDLGTAICYLLIGGSMLLLAGVQWRTFLRLLLVALILALPAWKVVLKDYQRQRILTFLSPEQDPLGSGYHANQSKIAVGSGAIAGKGFLQGSQTQLRFLPEQTTDFIFSVLAEEWGFIGSLFTLCLYALLLLRLCTLASRCEDRFCSFVSFGVAAMIFWHVVINIGMVVGSLPVVGLTLAILSFGGSSLITVMASLGLVTGFSMKRFMFA